MIKIPTDLKTIIALIFIVLLIVLYYGNYYIKNMIKKEIKDFYIKTEKYKLKTERQNITNKNMEIITEPNNISVDKETENFDINDNDTGIESYIDPLREKQDENMMFI